MAARKGSSEMMLFVSNLRWSHSSECLKAYFSKFGKVDFANVVFVSEAIAGWSKRYAFIGMDSIESSKKILSLKKHMLTDDHQIHVDGYNHIDGPDTEVMKTRINRTDNK